MVIAKGPLSACWHILLNAVNNPAVGQLSRRMRRCGTGLGNLLAGFFLQGGIGAKLLALRWFSLFRRHGRAQACRGFAQALV
jgi:hypothetical protein